MLQNQLCLIRIQLTTCRPEFGTKLALNRNWRDKPCTDTNINDTKW